MLSLRSLNILLLRCFNSTRIDYSYPESICVQKKAVKAIDALDAVKAIAG